MTDTFQNTTVLITGGAGFIGSHLGRRLERLGARVRVLDDLSGGFVENIPPGATLIRASILDHAALREAIRGCRFVFHQAAMVSVPESVADPEACMDVNVLGTERVLSAAREAGVQRVLFAASAAAYGNHPSLPSREDHLPDCWSPYAMSKVAGEHLMRTFSRCYNLSTVSLRYFNIFGPLQNPNSPYAAVISAFIKAVSTAQRPTIFGDGRQTRDFTYIDNVVDANLLAAASPTPLTGEVVNIGTGVRTSLLDVLQHVGRILARPVDPLFKPVRAGDIKDSVADITLAGKLLGYRPAIDFATGLTRTLKD